MRARPAASACRAAAVAASSRRWAIPALAGISFLSWVASSAFVAFANAGFYKFGADVRNEVTGATLTEVFKEIDKIRAEGSDGTELAGAKSYMRGVFALQTATQGGLSATLNNVYVFNLPKDYPETFRSTIAELTPVRVKAGAKLLGVCRQSHRAKREPRRSQRQSKFLHKPSSCWPNADASR